MSYNSSRNHISSAYSNVSLFLLFFLMQMPFQLPLAGTSTRLCPFLPVHPIPSLSLSHHTTITLYYYYLLLLLLQRHPAFIPSSCQTKKN